MVNQEFVKSIVSEVKASLFEGGAGSGNWGHKGRPGHRGGSLGGGGKGGGSEARASISNIAKRYGLQLIHLEPKYGHAIAEARTFISKEKAEKLDRQISSYLKSRGFKEISRSGGVNKFGFLESTFKTPEGKISISGAKFRDKMTFSVDYTHGPGAKKAGKETDVMMSKAIKAAGISAHMVKPGVHASTFYDKSGGLKTSEYKKLTDNQKVAVLKHGIQKYKENYVPKAKQAGMSSFALKTNRQVGALEGMRRAAITKAKGLSGKENRAAMHVAISLQQRAKDLAGVVKASGRRWVATM